MSKLGPVVVSLAVVMSATVSPSWAQDGSLPQVEQPNPFQACQCLLTTPSNGETLGLVVATSGSVVETTRFGFRDIEAGQTLSVGSEVITGAASAAEISFPVSADQCVVALASNQTLNLTVPVSGDNRVCASIAGETGQLAAFSGLGTSVFPQEEVTIGALLTGTAPAGASVVVPIAGAVVAATALTTIIAEEGFGLGDQPVSP